MARKTPLTDSQMSIQGKEDTSKIHVHGQGRPMVNMESKASIKNPVFLIMTLIVIAILIPVTVYHVSPGGDLMGGDTVSDGDDGSSAEVTDEDAVMGDFDAATFARDNCASCHGSDLTGSMGPTLYGIDPDTFFTVVREGKDAMPAFSEDIINDEELQFMAEYYAEAE